MGVAGTIRRWAAMGIAAVVALALAGCFVTPGRFTSTLELHRDGSFSFAYKGQIYILALGKLADMADKAKADAAVFEAQPCVSDDLEEHDCSKDELATQRKDWEEEQARKRSNDERERKSMQALLGGIDPADPRAAEELAERLRRQEGWRSVEYKGDGLYEVDFALTSRSSHDFSFPSIEGFPLANPFVIANVRQGKRIRVTAPGYAAQNGGPGGMAGMMGGMAGLMGGSSGTDEGGAPAGDVPQIDGTFRLLTDGTILANNTEEGPVPTSAGNALEWKITPRTTVAPMALVDLSGK